MTSEPWPLYDLFLDLPHPAASPASNKQPFVMSSPSATSGEIQQELSSSISRIARFAFPEFDDASAPPPPPDGGPGLNRFDVYTALGFQRHTFSLQLSSGQRLHGHVRRYLPTHMNAASRYDVGRRGVRALVLLTRASAGDATYAAILKTMEAVSAMQVATPKEKSNTSPQEYFLTTLYNLHVKYWRYYAQKPDDERRPMLLTVEGMEFSGAPKFAPVDTSRFLLPISLLQANDNISMTESPILPLLRCLGIPNALRLLSALLSDCRIILVSATCTRLTACARAALSMLAQGQLYWQHLFIPVLPPLLFQYLQAPMPYLVGMLASNMSKLAQMQELGPVCIVDLDRNELETRGIPSHLISSKIPDLLGDNTSMDPNSGGTYAEMSSADYLVQDLVQLIKADKRAMTGEANIQEAAAQTVKAVKSAFGRLKKKGKEYLAKQTSDYDTPITPDTPPDNNTEDDIYVEGAQNDVGEEEARISFAMFFLCLYGDMRWYLMAGPSPQLDRERFLQQKRALDGEALFPLYQNMCHSQMFEQFVKERVEEIRNRIPVTKDSPLFSVCANYHRQNQIDFDVVSVRRVARQVAQANPGRVVSQANANARRLAMALTSNKTFEGNHSQAVAQLVEMAHETTSVLCEVMSVIWMRLRDSRGMQWKHALFALQILRNLLFHGPLAAISEATDGLDRIRKFKVYSDTMRSQNSQQIQMGAREVYNLLVDRAKLFAIRRVCADRRRIMKNPPQGSLPKESRLRIDLQFRTIHAALNPTNRRQVAPAAGGERAAMQQGGAALAAGSQRAAMQQDGAAPAAVNDLLGFDSPLAPGNGPATAPDTGSVENLLGAFETQAAITKPPVAPVPQNRGAPVHPQQPSAPVMDAFASQPQQQPQAPSLQQQRGPSLSQPPPFVGPFQPSQQQQQRGLPPPSMQPSAPPQPPQHYQPHHPPSSMPPLAPAQPPRPPLSMPFAPAQQQRAPVQPPMAPPPQQEQPSAAVKLAMDPYAPAHLQPQPPIDPFAGQQLAPIPAPPPQQHHNRAGPFGGPAQQQPPPQGYPGRPPTLAQMSPPLGGMQAPPPGHTMQPQYQQQPNGYPGQPAMTYPPQQQPPPRKNLSQFDPMSR